jgi:simple sugar transport system ATP-binding protein
VLRLERVAKRFGTTRAVREVSLEFEAGRVHAIVGENGAGKSTLLRIAAGRLVPDGGCVRVDGDVVRAPFPRGSGVGMVEQQFGLVGALSALENLILGDEPCDRFGRIDVAEARARAGRAASLLGVAVPWDARVDALSMGDRQRVAIARAMTRSARALLLDEPTSVLAPAEVSRLYGLLRRLAAQGRAVAVVTHRLGEVLAHADVVSVMRQGMLVATHSLDSGDGDAARVLAAEVMAEDDAGACVRRTTVVPAGPPVVELRDVTTEHELRGVTLAVRAGEIVGVAGVDGNGQDALVRVVAGLERPSSGEIRPVRVAAVLADRDLEGIVGGATVADNALLGEFHAFARGGFILLRALAREAEARIRRAGVVPPELRAPVSALSGGNRQRLVVERALARSRRVDAFVFAQPTQGVDGPGAGRILAAIEGLASAGKAVLLVTVDLAELRRVCDRILVMSRGRLVAELSPDAPEAHFGEAMLVA